MASNSTNFTNSTNSIAISSYTISKTILLIFLLILDILMIWYLIRRIWRDCLKPKPKSIKLDSLPNELLTIIFDLLPLGHLLHQLPLTCTRFAQLTKVATARRRTLTIVFGSVEFGDHVTYFVQPQNSKLKQIRRQIDSKASSLIYPEIAQFNQKTVDKIVSLFPNVHSLHLYCTHTLAHHLDQLINGSLLPAYTTQLKTFYLMVHFAKEHNFSRLPLGDLNELSGALQETVSIINRMSNLRHLILNSSYPIANLELPVIGQLSEFYIQVRGSPFIRNDQHNDQLYESIIKFGAMNEKLKIVGIDAQPNTVDWLVTKIISNSMNIQKLSSSIVNLQLEDLSSAESLDRLKSLLSRLPNLIGLTILWDCSEEPLAALFKVLQPFTKSNQSKLSFLHLHIQPLRPPPDGSLDLTDFANSEHHQLESVKQLIVGHKTSSHESILRLHLETIFPNVKLVWLECICYECEPCGYAKPDYFTTHQDYRLKVEQCAKLMVAPLLQSKPKLKLSFRYTSYSDNDKVRVKF